MKTFAARFAVVAMTVVAGACTRAVQDARTSAVVVGTVQDAATGQPAADVRVEGPDGHSARTDERGRFTLTGLTVGTEGDLVAKAEDGRTATIRLRRLTAQRLEVVLQLRR